jgi:hypothetical protein
VRSAGLVVSFDVSRARNVEAPFFMLGWDWYGFHKKSVPGHFTPNLCYCIQWDLWGTQFIPVHLGHETLKYYFSYSGGTGMNSTKKRGGTFHTEHVTLHRIGSTGHIVHSDASRA